MSDEFNVGDVVQLKSGGPKMTVEKISDVDEDKIACCAWFDKNNIFKDEFDQRLLKHYKPTVGIGITRV
ncbi:YodC family protein [Teredinibacter turnerae]|uniref:YodC family protein n=1 Tax=Teredinibacter turnerae TaxID=2426 RepID=UPI0030CD2DB7